MRSYHIHIKGRVQGIGFRPFIYGLARQNDLRGSVSNTLDGVHIIVNCELCSISKFRNQIIEQAPSQAVITSIHTEEIPAKEFDDFRIEESNDDGSPDLLITPDFAICDSCAAELYDVQNRRYQYPFITCTKCGPRFSIERDLPYDRMRTSMDKFAMCTKCEQEYHQSGASRFYSQTNSCPDCKVNLWLADHSGTNLGIPEDELIEYVCKLISAGSIIAVKGIGGFLLMCDPVSEKSVLMLRERKHRPSKPFALLYPDRKSLERDFEPVAAELEELQSAESPIVLLHPRNHSDIKSISSYVAPGLNRIGVMMPYAPLLMLISCKLGKPLVATSGNVSGSPIVYRNEEVTDTLNGFADYFLLHDRDIQVPQDDSVVMFTRKHQQKVLVRRSRGYAPGLLQDGVDRSFDKGVLAMGALLKSTFCIWNHGRCHVSQFLGDTMEFDAQMSYERTMNHFLDLLHFKPEVIIVDKHPAYFSTQLGKQLSTLHQSMIVEIQHHKAHFWAVLAENQLLENDERILGVIFDGTGMGSDGAVWGGEFFSYNSGAIRRLGHFQYYPHILGDKMAMEPRLSALSLLYASGLDHRIENRSFTGDELEFYLKVLEHSSLNTSSVGRIFDAVSSLLGLCQVNSYEGEAAMYLENIAHLFRQRSKDFSGRYRFSLGTNGVIHFQEMIEEILLDIKHGVDHGEIALKFHLTLVAVIREFAIKAKVNSVAFSGGVFQNCLLIDLVIDEMGKDFNLYFHEQLSPNDESISYGQLVGYYMKERSRVNKEKSNQTISAVK